MPYAKETSPSCAFVLPDSWHTEPTCSRDIIQGPATHLYAVCRTCCVAASLEAVAARIELATSGRPHKVGELLLEEQRDRRN